MSLIHLLAMPTKLKELQTKVSQKTGHHYYWEYGYVTAGWKEQEVPKPKSVGMTARIFGLCSGFGGVTEIRLRYSDSYFVSAMIEFRQYNAYVAGYDNSKMKRFPKKQIPQPDFTYFSIAVRIHKSDYLASLYEETVMYTEKVGDIMGYKYDLGFRTTDHSILSLHITNEVTERTSPYWGSDSVAPYYFPLNTVAVYTVYVTESNPSE
ncbi:uncharacterized protein LOC125941302 [Dermacentor silvarum]|uniref:uncharacterized protein LOC125941302 n=1 Tax=Dermacentor silvarum TaxID=543639 RepID=UPI0021009832|nr:uncharacterized protein LOC125941302 [Dermacentor silvarum]